MRFPFDLRSLINRLFSTYWFVPSIVTVGAFGLGLGLVAIDTAFPAATSWLGFAYGGGAEGARALLTAVAGSTITVVSVVFSVMVVALTVSSQHFGPRLLNNFMRDTSAQLVLGTFTGTYAYCLVVLRTVQGDGGENYSVFVPHLAVTASVALTLLSVGMLIYYVHHVAVSMQVSSITANVAREFERTIRRMFPDSLGEEAQPEVREPPAIPAGAVTFASRRSAYLQEIDEDAMLALAGDLDGAIWLLVRPGDFLVEGVPIAAVHPAPEDRDEVADALHDAFVTGEARTPYQDSAFAVQQLVEVALRALSPGINEPFTAITCIERLGQGLAGILGRAIPSAVREDEKGTARVIARPRTFVELVGQAFEPIALHAGRNPAIGETLIRTLRTLAVLARRDEDRRAIVRVAENCWTAVAAEVGERPRRDLARQHQELLRVARREQIVDPRSVDAVAG